MSRKGLSLSNHFHRSNSYLSGIVEGTRSVGSSCRSTVATIGSHFANGVRDPKCPSLNGSNKSILSEGPHQSTEELISSLKKEEEENISKRTRASWDNKFQYMLAVIGYAVGLGNVWRFPYLVQKNGGGAFLIPYTLMLALEGIPIFFLELAIGQRMRKGAIGAWNQISPFLGGIGLCCAMISFIVGLYYNTIIAWCLYYLVLSFRRTLPWRACPLTQIGKYKNETRVIEECRRSGPTAYFWYRETLNISASVDQSGLMNWWILVSLAAAWFLIFLCIAKGIQSSGKVVYVTAIFPYLILLIFFFRGVTLPGYENGLYHLFVPEFSRLSDPQVWIDAASQIFYSLGLGFGSLIALSSYNPPRNNCHRDAFLIALTNCCTSLFAGIVVFSILGFKATKRLEVCQKIRSLELVALFNDTEISPPPAGSLVNITSALGEVTSIIMPNITTCSFKEEIKKSASGTGLTFIAFTEAINQFSASPVWAVLFFLMLLTIGLDSMFATLEGVITPLVDLGIFPDVQKHPSVLGGVLCMSSFLISFIFANQAGPYIFVLFDEYVTSLPLLVVVIFEILTISYGYGLYRFSNDIELMTGRRPSYYMLICWKYVCPLIIALLIIVVFVNLASEHKTYEAWNRETGSLWRLPWPAWCMGIAACLILLSTIWIPLVALLRKLRPHSWPVQSPSYFPTQLIQIERNLKPHEPTKCERNFLFRWEPNIPASKLSSDKITLSENNTVFI